MITGLRWTLVVSAASMAVLIFGARPLLGAEPMTGDELARLLESIQADERELLADGAVEIEEDTPDFLNGARHLRVTIRAEYHPVRLHFVYRADDRIYRPWIESLDFDLMRQKLGIHLASEDAALRYARWILDIQEGPDLQFVSEPKDVILAEPAAGDTEGAQAAAEARKLIQAKLRPPQVARTADGFTITTDAVQQDTLVRYTIRLTADGRPEWTSEVILEEMPVASIELH